MKVAIIGASYLQLPLILKAKEMGYETHVFAWECGDDGEKEAHYFYPISIVEKEKILIECIKIGINGICSIASDLATITVNFIANEMGLVGNSMECTLNCTNKFEMRTCFAKRNDQSPKFLKFSTFDNIQKLSFEYPIIVKPSDRSGSRGITKLDSDKNLKEAFDKAYRESFSKEVLLEEYVEGKEYSIECISFQGDHHYLAATLKHTTNAPNFIETGHEEPADLDGKCIMKIQMIVFHALDSLGVQNGASHTEIKIDKKGNVKIIEIGARMGGDCIGSHLVGYSTGYDYIKMVLDVSLGLAPNFTQTHKGFPVEIKYIFCMEDITRLREIEESDPESILFKSNIEVSLLGKTTDSSNRLGCYIVRKEE